MTEHGSGGSESVLQERDRFVHVLESMSTGYCSLDRDWRYTYVNAEAERLLGTTRQAMLGRSFWELYPAAIGTDFEKAYRTAMESGTTVVFDAYYPAPLNAWYELRAQGLPDGLAVYFLDINAREVARQEARAAQEQAELVSGRLRTLTEVILELNQAETVADLSRFIVDRALVQLGATGGAVSLLVEGGTILRAETSSALGEGAQNTYADLAADSPLAAAVAARTGGEILLRDRAASLAFAPEMEAVCDRSGCQAWACLPLRGGTGCLGTLVVAWSEVHEPDPAELGVLRALAQQCAHSLERLRRRDQEQAAAQSAVNLAETLQRSLLTEPRQAEGLQIEARYRAAAAHAQVGGDWYDSFRNGEGRTCLVVGDATGHDKDAAAVMGQIRNLLRGIAYTVGEPPAAVLSRLDRALRDLQVDSLATGLLAVLREEPGRPPVLHWSNAGHLPPLYLEPGRPPRLLSDDADLLLGLDPETPRTDHQLQLAPGSTVLLYTDGLVERRGASLDDGLAWLTTVSRDWATRPLQALCDTLLGDIADHAEDDIALLAVRIEDGPPVPRELTVPGDPAAVSQARAFVRQACQDDGIDDDTLDTAVLLTSEVVTNAVLHGRSDARVRVSFPAGRVRIDVSDSSSRLPLVTDADDDATGGRGLALVAALAQGWGVSERFGGKTVWFEVPTARQRETMPRTR